MAADGGPSLSRSAKAIPLTDEYRELLADVPLLALLDGDALDAGLARCHLLEVPPAVRIVRQGEYDDTFFVIVKGRCEVAKESGSVGGTVANIVEGRQRMASEDAAASSSDQPKQSRTLGSLKAGNFFGELSCMSPWPRTSTVYSTGTTVVLEIDTDVFNDWMEASDGFRAEMEQAYMQRGLVSLLRGIDAFSMLGNAEVRALIDGATLHDYKKGQPIVSEGEVGDAFYVIRGGVVAVQKQVGEEEKTVSYLRAGNFFGEMALLDGEPRNATVMATNSTEVIRIAREKFVSLIEANPAAKHEIERKVSERLRTGEAVLGDDDLANALTFMAGQGILEGADVLVVDMSRCIFCGHCEEACENSHDVSLISLHGPSHNKFLFPTACRNCDDPVCLTRCPVDAITRDIAGEVRIADHCIGCTGCAVNCPYDTISMTPISEAEGERVRSLADFKKPVTQQAIKCDLCEGIDTGPQCVRSCPTAAILRFPPKELVSHVLGTNK